ncbi:hypothetical protein [Tenacibaculum sp. C7A-26P2]|uniref:hypothetical protein n=1 Tax=Tenacibaculum sp. C7A-26P2 TaxID=3447504 RepID=UPI003F8557ED
MDLYFGSRDSYVLDNNWFDGLVLNKMILEGSHMIYKKESFSKFICSQLLYSKDL